MSHRAKSASRMAGRPTKTISQLPVSRGCISRKFSRIKRRARFRWTELPTFFPQVNPTRYPRRVFRTMRVIRGEPGTSPGGRRSENPGFSGADAVYPGKKLSASCEKRPQSGFYADSVLRPFLRRRVMTLRPVWDFILLRKPCTFFRCLFFG